MIKQLGFAFLVTLLLIFSFHKSVAANISVLPPLASEDKKVPVITCENLAQILTDYSSDLSISNQKVSNYFVLAAGQYGVWYKEMSTYEGLAPQWDESVLSPFKSSGENLETSSSVVYSFSSHADDFVTVVKKSIETCVSDSPAREQAIVELENYLMADSENLSAMADFLAQMNTRLQERTGQWQQLIGAKESVSPGYFIFLSEDSDIFAEAATLSAENAAYVSSLYSDFRASLGHIFLSLAPE